MTDKPTKLLIDADLVLFRSAAACERDVRWDEDNHVLFANADEAWINVEKAVERLCARFETDDVLMCLSEGRNFRYSVDPEYKANRKGTRKPVCYVELVERTRDKYEAFSHDGLEADDVMGIFGSRMKHAIICSIDKDMQTIPCTLWDGKQVRKIDRADADYQWLFQTLVGDSADGYPGLPGCGPVKAKSILGNASTNRWQAVVDAYEAKGLTADDALRQARLARILRTEDWDGEKKQPILWTP